MTSAEQIKSRLDVVTFVQGYVKLEKAGVNYKARCPFHSEKTASFYVSPARDIWHCFGCGRGGDIFKFLMEMEGIDFSEALRILAERAGVELSRDNAGPERSLRVKLLALLEDATAFYEEQLAHATDALAYVRSRGLEPETIKSFRIGFAPDGWRVLGDHLKRKGYTETEIEKAGLSIAGTKGAYDRFRSRIIFPLEDSLGRVVGFGGRVWPPDADSGGAKYINTPQTLLYDKSRFLFGFGKAKNEIRLQKQAVVTEGYMDCILSQQAGIGQTVAVSGTALTEHHLGMIRRLADAIVFAFDVDKAGIEASRRAVGLAHAQDFSVKIADIEGGKDPADIVLKDPEVWRTTVADAKESIAFFMKKALAGAALSDPLVKKRIGEEILPMVALFKNEIERGHWVKQLAAAFRIGEDAIWRELGRYMKAPKQDFRPAPEVITQQPRTRKARLEERIAGLLLADPKLALLGDLPAREDVSLAATGVIFDRLREGGIRDTKEEFLRSLPEDVRPEAERYVFEAEVFLEAIQNRETEFLDMLRSWKELSLKEKLAKLHEEISSLEALGERKKADEHMARFQELTAHLAKVIEMHHASEKKEKKDRF